MADPRAFTLIGEFKDGITPELARINKQLAALKANFAGVGSRKGSGFRGATQEIGKLVSAHKNLAKSVKDVQSELRSSLGVLAQYRKEMGKAAAATRAFQKAGGNLGSKAFATNMRDANTAAQQYLRTLEKINRESGRAYKGMRMPPPPPGGGGRGGYGGGMNPPPEGRGLGSRDGGFPMARFTLALGLSQALSEPITKAIVSGFQIGVDLMQKPFQYFANALSERIRDEQSDIKAAGGIFSISSRQKDPLVRTMDEAMEFTQENNKLMAVLAAALPGSTQDYIEVSKRLSDSIAKVVGADSKRAIDYANKLRGEEGKASIVGEDRAAQKQAYTQLLGQLTKQTVLAGQGGGGRGGAMGAYGMPQLTERMLTQDQVTMGQFQRYSAIFRDPLVMEALERFIPKINATTKGTMDRFEILDKMFQEVVPPEMVRKFQRSSEGIMEMFRTAITGPETGIFGIGRKMQGLGVAMDDYGRYIEVLEDGTRKVVTSIGEATKIDLSVFDLFRDIVANVAIVLGPIIDNLTLIWDPLQKVASLLTDARHATGKFLLSFERYTQGFLDMAKAMDEGSRNKFFKTPAQLRGSLAAINNLFANLNIISEADFQANAAKLMSLDFDAGLMIKEFLDTFLTSSVAGDIGKTIGEVIGTVLKEVAGATGFISGRLQKTNALFDGLKKGFDAAEGTQAFKDIFKDVFSSLFKVFTKIATILPLEAYILAGIMAVMPVAIQTLSMAIAHRLSDALFNFLERGSLGKMMSNMFQKGGRVKPVTVTDLGTTPQPRGLLPPAGGTTASQPAGAITKFSKFSKVWSNFTGYFAKVGPRFLSFFKGIGGKLAILGAAITTVTSLFEGKDLARSLAEGAGPLLGAALGAALIPIFGPIGPMIGAAIGGKLGQMEGVVRPLEEAFRAIGNTIGPSFTALWDALGSAVDTVKSLLMALVGPFVKLDGTVSETTATVIALKIALTPIVAAFQLLEQVVNVVASGLKGLELAVAYARRGLSALNPFADKEKQAQLDAYIARLGAEQQSLNENFYKSFGRHKQYYETAPATGGVSGVTPTAADMSWYNSAKSQYRGGLGDAVRSELKHKPAGSDLVIANSSETVIPAAGGYGMKTFIDTLSAGFAAVENSFKIVGKGVEESDKKSEARSEKTDTKITDYHNQTQAQILKINQQLASMSTMGGLFGGGGMELGGGYGGAGSQIAGALGNFIKQTGGAPGSIHEHPAHGGVKGRHAPGSYHYSGRAIDIGAYANEQAGVIARIKQFNAKMGVKPVEFLHAGNDPNHQDHVHVAYAGGLGNPILAPTRAMARQIDANALGSQNIKTYTAGKGEFGGGNTVGDIYVTVNANGISDYTQVAYEVAREIQRAVYAATDANVLV